MFTKNEIEMEIENDKVFGEVSVEVKLMPFASRDSLQSFVCSTGITLKQQVDTHVYTIHGSWLSILRARHLMHSAVSKDDDSELQDENILDIKMEANSGKYEPKPDILEANDALVKNRVVKQCIENIHSTEKTGSQGINYWGTNTSAQISESNRLCFRENFDAASSTVNQKNFPPSSVQHVHIQVHQYNHQEWYEKTTTSETGKDNHQENEKLASSKGRKDIHYRENIAGTVDCYQGNKNISVPISSIEGQVNYKEDKNINFVGRQDSSQQNKNFVSTENFKDRQDNSYEVNIITSGQDTSQYIRSIVNPSVEDNKYEKGNNIFTSECEDSCQEDKSIANNDRQKDNISNSVILQDCGAPPSEQQVQLCIFDIDVCKDELSGGQKEFNKILPSRKDVLSSRTCKSSWKHEELPSFESCCGTQESKDNLTEQNLMDDTVIQSQDDAYLMNQKTGDGRESNCKENQSSSNDVLIRSSENSTSTVNCTSNNEHSLDNENDKSSDEKETNDQFHESNSEELFKCDICPKSFSKMRYLKMHKRRHVEEKKFACTYCGWKFFEQNKLKIHMQSHLPAKDRQLAYKCHLCWRQFYNRTGWQEHMNIHTGNRPYKCTSCDAEFAQRAGLHRHKVIHEKIPQPYKCNICQKSFSFPEKLKSHMIVHTGEKKNVCKCGKIYTTKTSLKRHQRMGCEANPFISQKANVSQNTGQQSSEDVAFMCGLCELQFDSLEKATAHVSNHTKKVSNHTTNS